MDIENGFMNIYVFVKSFYMEVLWTDFKNYCVKTSSKIFII